MTHADTSAKHSGFGRRLRRLPFVLALMLGLLLSLIHCAGDAFAFAADGAAVIATSNTGTAPDLPDQLLPAHSGHCLSHVTAQPMTITCSPRDLQHRAPTFAADRPAASWARLPLFKPPRA